MLDSLNDSSSGFPIVKTDATKDGIVSSCDFKGVSMSVAFIIVNLSSPDVLNGRIESDMEGVNMYDAFKAVLISSPDPLKDNILSDCEMEDVNICVTLIMAVLISSSDANCWNVSDRDMESVNICVAFMTVLISNSATLNDGIV